MTRRDRRLLRMTAPAAALLGTLLSTKPALAGFPAAVPGPGSLMLVAIGAGIVALAVLWRRR